jgi:hypothetical protein
MGTQRSKLSLQALRLACPLGDATKGESNGRGGVGVYVGHPGCSLCDGDADFFF